MKEPFQEALTSWKESSRLAHRKTAVASNRWWADWARNACDAGAAKGHSFTKVPQQWVPTEALSSYGVITTDPLNLLRAQADSLAGIWHGSPERHPPVHQSLERPSQPLPLLTLHSSARPRRFSLGPRLPRWMASDQGTSLCYVIRL